MLSHLKISATQEKNKDNKKAIAKQLGFDLIVISLVEQVMYLYFTHEKCQSFEQEEINLLFYINVYKRLVSYITLMHMRDQSC